MERPYTGHALGRFLISLMPNANKVEGRILESELDKPGDTRLSDGPYVIERCAAIVLKSQTKQADSTTLSRERAGDGAARPYYAPAVRRSARSKADICGGIDESSRCT